MATADEEEARAFQLLRVPFAWPLLKRVRKRQRFSTARHPVLDRNLRFERRFVYFQAHDFQPDKLSEAVVARNQFKETYARGMKQGGDSTVPGDVMDAIETNQMPQFSLRNIGRMELDVDLNDPLPFERTAGVGGEPGAELAEVRTARVPKPEMAQVWSVEFVRRVRASFRRILLEDPWDLRFGHEVWSAADGRKHDFVIEGTHPDDMPGSAWGPALIPVPEEWAEGPPGSVPFERAFTLHDARRVVEAGAKKGG
jgi:hypothetical protein